MARGALVSRQPPAPSFSSNQKNLCRFNYYCAARPCDGRDANSPAIRTELLRLFSPNKSRYPFERNRGELPSVSCCIEEDVLEVVKDDYGQAYFLTGQVKKSLSTPKQNNPHRPSTNPINKSSQPLFAASFQQLPKMSENPTPLPSPSPSPAQYWPSVDSDRTVICIGDIHGYFSKLLRLWSALQSAVPPASFDTSLIIFLGDYCDRGPQTRQVLDFLIGLPAKYPRQRHVFLCGNHDLAFAAFVGALPARGDGSARWDDTWEEYALSEEREGWYKGEGYAEMHVQGRRWAGTVNRFNAKKGMAYKGSIYDSAPTFESYGVPHASPDLVKAVPDEHKKFLRDLVWVHEEENVAIDTEKGRMNCRLIAVHAGLEKTKEVQERLQVLRDRDSSLHTVQELRGRMNVWDIPKDLLENPTILVSGHHGKLHIDGLRFVIDESGGLEHLPIAAIVFPSQQIVRDNDS